ncbi:hypothetical protein [Dictyobacter kobayashii]|uniref:Uncharacterized protein n=1 Tax=Dictyobacter kobayashii TaxID=2014872 RepID=A0A402AX12_9CHLR|nr:hypothetical protein [Dictyobacter kobayashii]GCE23594.1 hypothetical protein KDK_73940 [Dictyobacter kobayashii]
MENPHVSVNEVRRQALVGAGLGAATVLVGLLTGGFGPLAELTLGVNSLSLSGTVGFSLGVLPGFLYQGAKALIPAP